MLKISVEQASRNLKVILKRVAAGEEVWLIDRNQVVARLVPPQNKEKSLSETRLFRAEVVSYGEALSSTVIKARIEERY